MAKAVFDICYLDQVAFDHEAPVFMAAVRLDIDIGEKSSLAIDLSEKCNMETIIGEKVRMTDDVGTRVNMLVVSDSKSLLDIELLGGGS